MKTILAYFGLFLLATAVSTCSTHLELRDVFANEAEAEERLRGFAGYEYESGISGIAADMESEGYTLIERTGSSLWYRSTFLGIDCELGYVFEDQLLIGGSFILHAATDQDFILVNDHLRETYDAEVNVEISDGVVIAKLKGPDSLIIQTLDLNEGTHQVEYFHET